MLRTGQSGITVNSSCRAGSNQLSTRLQECRDAPLLEEAIRQSVGCGACPSRYPVRKPRPVTQGADRLVLVRRVSILAPNLRVSEPTRSMESVTNYPSATIAQRRALRLQASN